MCSGREGGWKVAMGGQAEVDEGAAYFASGFQAVRKEQNLVGLGQGWGRQRDDPAWVGILFDWK